MKICARNILCYTAIVSEPLDEWKSMLASPVAKWPVLTQRKLYGRQTPLQILEIHQLFFYGPLRPRPDVYGGQL